MRFPQQPIDRAVLAVACIPRKNDRPRAADERVHGAGPERFEAYSATEKVPVDSS